MPYYLLLLPLAIIVGSYFEIYKVEHILAVYIAPDGTVKGYKFDYSHRWSDTCWMDIAHFENYICARKGIMNIRIIRLEVKTSWKIRKILQENEREG